MGIESETSLASAPANFCQKKNSKNSYNGSTLNPPQLYVPWDLDFHIYEKETPCIAYLWRLFYTSFTTTTHFSTRLTYNPNKYFYQSELFEFWGNCNVPFLHRINFDDWMVHINSTSLQTRRWKSFTFSHWWQKFSPCQQSGASLLLHFAFISLLPIPIPPLSRKWRLSKLMMDAVLLKMQLEVFWL